MIKEGSINKKKYKKLNKIILSVESKDGKETSNKTYIYNANGN